MGRHVPGVDGIREKSLKDRSYEPRVFFFVRKACTCGRISAAMLGVILEPADMRHGVISNRSGRLALFCNALIRLHRADSFILEAKDHESAR